MIKLKDILREDEVTDKFGKVALGSSLPLARLQGKEKEKDTEYEKELKDALEQWAKYPLRVTIDFLNNNYNLFKKAAKKFPSIFLPDTPKGTQLYRGLKNLHSRNNKKLKQNVFSTKRKDWKKQGNMYVSSKPIIYNPHEPIQSWTSDLNIAHRFSELQTDFGGVILLTTKQTDEFLFSQKLMKYLYKSDEKETLHFGKEYKQPVYLMIDEDLYPLD